MSISRLARGNPARRHFSSGNAQCDPTSRTCREGGAAYRDFRIRLRMNDDTEFGQQAAEVAEALTVINMWELLTYGDQLPCCLGCGNVRYVEPKGCVTEDCSTNRVIRTNGRVACQLLLDARGLYEKQQGTCMELACERAARLRLGGEDARVVVVPRENYYGKRMLGQYHAYVAVYEGGREVRTEDPAQELIEGAHGECNCTSCRGGH